MNKKGFTLAELIGVIVVLSLICLITVPAIASVLKANKKSLCETQLNNILTAAKSYASENILSMPINNNESKKITFKDLVNIGFMIATMFVIVGSAHINVLSAIFLLIAGISALFRK